MSVSQFGVNFHILDTCPWIEEAIEVDVEKLTNGREAEKERESDLGPKKEERKEKEVAAHEKRKKALKESVKEREEKKDKPGKSKRLLINKMSSSRDTNRISATASLPSTASLNDVPIMLPLHTPMVSHSSDPKFECKEFTVTKSTSLVDLIKLCDEAFRLSVVIDRRVLDDNFGNDSL